MESIRPGFFSWLILECWGSRDFQRVFQVYMTFVGWDSLRYSFSTSRFFCYCSLATKKDKTPKEAKFGDGNVSCVCFCLLVIVLRIRIPWDENPHFLTHQSWVFLFQPPNSRKSMVFGLNVLEGHAGWWKCVIHPNLN